jgi:hypothetical protein
MLRSKRTKTKMNDKEFWSILQDIPETKQIFYRLYYNDDGSPIIYSMEDLPGNYIKVDQSIYILAPFNVKVSDGKLVYIKPVITVKKLQPSIDGTACNPQDVCIVVNIDQPHIKWTTVSNELN